MENIFSFYLRGVKGVGRGGGRRRLESFVRSLLCITEEEDSEERRDRDREHTDCRPSIFLLIFASAYGRSSQKYHRVVTISVPLSIYGIRKTAGAAGGERKKEAKCGENAPWMVCPGDV